MRTATTLTVLMLIMMAFPTEAKAQTPVSSWSELESAAEAATTTTPKNIKLMDNITRDATEEVHKVITVTGKVTLDLNGYSINGNNMDENIFHVDYDGDLTITDLTEAKDGQIFGVQRATNTSTINIAGTGKVTLAAGTIGGPNIGVALGESGSFTMTGGTITGNSIGVNILSDGYLETPLPTMTVSGNVNISGNTRDVSLAYEPYVFSPIHIGGKLHPNSRIGVSTGENASYAIGKTFTSGLSGNGSASNFFVNEPDVVWNIGILPNGNELCFAEVYQSSGALQILWDNENINEKYAVLDCNYTGNDPVSLDENYQYSGRVLVYRNFNTVTDANAYSTLMLPFAVNKGELVGVDAVYEFVGMGVDGNGKKAVVVEPSDDDLLAYKPYLVKMNSTTLNITKEDVTIKKPTGAPCVVQDKWCLWGTLEYIQWLSNKGRASEIGSVYGFAASSDGNVSVGEFVKVESGASIKPFRAYLKYNKPSTTRGLTRGDDDEELPDRMRVIVRDSSSETGILKVKSEKPKKAWYALDGRQLNGKPNMKGVYINGGRKVVIK